jgi:hypothetical protein
MYECLKPEWKAAVVRHECKCIVTCIKPSLHTVHKNHAHTHREIERESGREGGRERETVIQDKQYKQKNPKRGKRETDGEVETLVVDAERLRHIQSTLVEELEIRLGVGVS